ncbi:hypothetical protein [Trichocoleus sp. FACHB-262]|nr:hypothetical protein [Trichocoleus sp. FACHB-262]MBD2124547.1 hypothetical protein [Trichocoleus sp. FACHB-262]
MGSIEADAKEGTIAIALKRLKQFCNFVGSQNFGLAVAVYFHFSSLNI